MVGEPGARLARRLGSGALRADPGAAHLDIGGAHLAGGPQRLGERPGGDPHAIGLCEPRDHLDPAFRLVGRHGAEGVPHILVEQRAHAGLREGARPHRKRSEQRQRVLVGGEELAGAPAAGPWRRPVGGVYLHREGAHARRERDTCERGRRQVAMAAAQGDPSVAVGRARRPLDDVEGLFWKRRKTRLVNLEEGGPAEPLLVAEPLFGMGVERLGKPPVVALEVVHLGHGHEEVPPGAADLALDVSPLLAGARVAEAGREAVAQPEPAEEVGPHDRVAPPPPGLGGVVEHDDGGRPRCARSSP